MKPSIALNAILATYHYNMSGVEPDKQINLFLRGAPGTAKSSLVYQAGEALDVNVAELRLPGMDAADIKGMPTISNNRTVWCSPEEIPADPDWKGFVFLDEPAQAPLLVMSAVSQLILQKRIGNTFLPKGAVIISAGNRKSDRAAVNEMPRHLSDRYTFIDVEADIDDFTSWAIKNNIRPEVTSFVRSRTELLHKFDPSQPKSPTLRGWMFVSGILQMANLHPLAQHAMIAGTVGEGAAIEFMGHLRLYGQIPTVEEIIANPKGTPVPTGENAPAMSYALSSSLSRVLDSKNAKAIIEYISRMESEEFAVLTVRDALERDASLKKVEHVRNWAARNASLII